MSKYTFCCNWPNTIVFTKHDAKFWAEFFEMWIRFFRSAFVHKFRKVSKQINKRVGSKSLEIVFRRVSLSGRLKSYCDMVCYSFRSVGFGIRRSYRVALTIGNSSENYGILYNVPIQETLSNFFQFSWSSAFLASTKWSEANVKAEFLQQSSSFTIDCTICKPCISTKHVVQCSMV